MKQFVIMTSGVVAGEEGGGEVLDSLQDVSLYTAL